MYEKFNIRQFREALYNGDRSEMTDDELKTVHLEYIDTAQLYENEEFKKTSYIYYLNGRINYVKMFMRLQREFINNFDIPYIREFDKIKEKYGIVLYWNGNSEAFLKSISSAEKREFKYQDEVENKVKELTEFRLKKQNNEVTVKQPRGSFIKTVNSLGKIGYNINWNTTVEDFSYMILQQSEEAKNYKK